MALSQQNLAASLKAIFVSSQPSAADAANALASAYVSYASQGMVGASKLEVPSAKKTAMAAALLAVLSLPLGNPATVAGAWSAAVAAFWAGIPVIGVQSGSVTACPGAASLIASLTVVFSNPLNTADIAAQGMAAALHAATLTATATVAPPAGTVLTVL